MTAREMSVGSPRLSSGRRKLQRGAEGPAPAPRGGMAGVKDVPSALARNMGQPGARAGAGGAANAEARRRRRAAAAARRRGSAVLGAMTSQQRLAAHCGTRPVSTS